MKGSSTNASINALLIKKTHLGNWATSDNNQMI